MILMILFSLKIIHCFQLLLDNLQGFNRIEFQFIQVFLPVFYFLFPSLEFLFLSYTSQPAKSDF